MLQLLTYISVALLMRDAGYSFLYIGIMATLGIKLICDFILSLTDN